MSDGRTSLSWVVVASPPLREFSSGRVDQFIDDDYDDDDDDAVLEEDDHDGNNDNGKDYSLQPWKELLEIPGRASWRVSCDTPEPLTNAMYKILEDGDRTPKQLRRAHRKVLAMHSDLAELRERERRRMVNGGRSVRPRDDDHSFTPNNKKRNGFVGIEQDDVSVNPVYYGFDETLATLRHRLVPNYAITKRVLSECQSLLGGPTLSAWCPKRIVDFGIGCGSASVAAIDMFRDDQTGQTAVEWIHGIEPSVPMRECARKLVEELEREVPGTTTSPRITFGNSLSPTEESQNGTFDLALLTYTANEFADATSCLTAAALLFEKLKPNGVLVMIEPGTPDGFNSTRMVRNMLLDCCPPNDPDFEFDNRCHILAPCTHNGRCPMERHKRNFVKKRGKLGHDLPQEKSVDDKEARNEIFEIELQPADDDDLMELGSLDDTMMTETEAFNSAFCSFVQHIPGDTTRKGEKFSYLVAQKQRFSKPEDSRVPNDRFQGDHLTGTLFQAFDAASREDDGGSMEAFKLAQEMRRRYLESEEDELGLELIRGSVKRGSMGRIIRAPIKKKGHVYVDYCASPGRIVRGRITRAMSNNVAPGVFGAARKSRWGGLWPDMMRKTDDNKKPDM